jgi:SAM-dependent methyltransferase
MNKNLNAFSYSGNELEAFSAATNWKAYWSSQIAPYIGKNVLELGAGIGATAIALNQRNYDYWLALEPDKIMCERIEAKLIHGEFPSAYKIRHGTSNTLARDELFDTILYIDVLEHIEQDKEELERVSDHLIDGGHIIIVAPAHDFLYTEFDRKIGHYRRYNSKMLRKIIPTDAKIHAMYYLDSVGMLASIANKIFLKSDTPSLPQIKFWDQFMVRISRWVDRILLHRLGKSIICIIKKPNTK